MSDSGLERLKGKALTISDHDDPDLHWIGGSLAVPTQTEIAATVGSASSPGDSPFVARADHIHKLENPYLLAWVIDPASGIPLTLKAPGNNGSLYVSNANNTPYISFYSDDLGTRYGYIQASTSSLVINSEAGDNILFLTSGAEQARIDAVGNFLHQKSVANNRTNGIEILTTGTIVGTRSDAGTPFVVNKESPGSGSPMIALRIDNVQIGSISRNGATSAVLYNTTSTKDWKGNIQDIDDDSALERLMKWRPVSFQWKYAEGFTTPTKKGIPSGDVVHGFIAEEINEIQPNAVNMGYGTEEEHDIWVENGSQGEDPYFPPGMDNSALVPDLTAAVQALVRRTELLENRVKELESSRSLNEII